MGQARDLVNHFMQSQDPSLLAEDFRFLGPVDQTIGVEAFLQPSASFFPLVTGMSMLKQFEQGNDVCSTYEMDLKAPSGTSLTLHIADWVTVNEGKLVEDRMYYDAREYARVFGHERAQSLVLENLPLSRKGTGSPACESGIPMLVIHLKSLSMLRQRNTCLAQGLPTRAVERCLSQAAMSAGYPVA